MQRKMVCRIRNCLRISWRFLCWLWVGISFLGRCHGDRWSRYERRVLFGGEFDCRLRQMLGEWLFGRDIILRWRSLKNWQRRTWISWTNSNKMQLGNWEGHIPEN